ncbi:glycosyltransferase, partial [bacterium]|nr:glycosyltransferase [bacterium]
GNIHYHFIKIGVPFRKRKWPWWFELDFNTDFLPFNLKTKRLVKKINPDLVNLIGAENAYYSSSILHISGYPKLVTIQGFISLNNEAGTGDAKMVGKRIKIENKILKNLDHFGVEATWMEHYIKSINPTAKMHWFHLPFARTKVDAIPDKEFDLVFFARVTKMKGIEDVIKALELIKPKKSDIKLEIIGMGDDNYMNYLKKMVDDLDLKENVHFKGFIPTQEEMHFEVLKARICVLPTYNDTIPGTIVESMLLGIPVITYKTGGIPDLNKTQENVIVLEQGDIEGLADEIMKLLNDPERQNTIGDRSKSYAIAEFDNVHSTKLLVETYRDIIKESSK